MLGLAPSRTQTSSRWGTHRGSPSRARPCRACWSDAPCSQCAPIASPGYIHAMRAHRISWFTPMPRSSGCSPKRCCISWCTPASYIRYLCPGYARQLTYGVLPIPIPSLRPPIPAPSVRPPSLRSRVHFTTTGPLHREFVCPASHIRTPATLERQPHQNASHIRTPATSGR